MIIDEVMNKRKDESLLLWKMRLCWGKLNKVDPYVNYDWSELVDILELDVHYDTLRKWGYAYSEAYQELVLNNDNKSEDANREAKELLRNIKLEKVKMSDERNELNRQIREYARIQNLGELLVNNMNNLTPIIFNKDYIVQSKNNEAVLMLSDVHYGLGIDILPNHYNPDVAVERLNILVDKTVLECKKQNVDILNIFCLGDLISGVIHNTIRLLNRESLTDQIIHVSELVSQMVYELSKEIPSINIHMVQGNHERVFEKDENLKNDSYTELVQYYVKNRIKNIKNVRYIENEISEEILTAEIKGYKFIGCHGDKTRKEIAKSQLLGITNINADYVCLGHFHNSQMILEHATPIFINGCVCGTDEYAYAKKLFSRPSQKLLIVTDKGVECMYDLILD